MTRPIYHSKKDRDREEFVRAVLHHKYNLEHTSSLNPYDFIGSWPYKHERVNALFELKARSYKMAEVPEGNLYLTFDKYQKIMSTLIPNKKLLIMNPEGLWIGDFNDILKDTEDWPRLIIGGRYDRNDFGDIGLHVLFPVDKLTNKYTREELLRLQHAYNETKQIFSAEEIQRLLSSSDQHGNP